MNGSERGFIVATVEIRVLPDGVKKYRVKIRRKGCPTLSATFDRKTDAKNWATQTEAAIQEGRHFKNNLSKKYTLSDLIDRYIADVLPTKPKMLNEQTRQLLRWKKELGCYLLSDISPSLIAEVRDRLLAEEGRPGIRRSPSTVVRYMAALSHAFTIAVKEWAWLDSNPVNKVRRPKEPRGRVRFLNDDDLFRLLDACEQSKTRNLYPIVMLAVSTGMRLGEILSIRWENLDLDKGFVILEQTKNGERRRVPIEGPVLSEMVCRRKNIDLKTGLIFHSLHSKKKPASIRGAWLKALDTAGINDFRFHDLRHCAASYLVMSGASLAEIAEVLGHKTLQMVKRYAHLSDSHTSEVVRRMNDKFIKGARNE